MLTETKTVKAGEIIKGDRGQRVTVGSYCGMIGYNKDIQLFIGTSPKGITRSVMVHPSGLVEVATHDLNRTLFCVALVA